MAASKKPETAAAGAAAPPILAYSLKEMQRLLEAIEPPSSSAALNALRRAFPESPLPARMSAYDAYVRKFRTRLRGQS